MSGEDVMLRCSECGQEFAFTASEQQFFRERGYSSPKRCKSCRQAKQSAGSYGRQDSGRAPGYSSNTGTETTVVCAGCGQTTTVPFEPRGDRPVYCKNCYKPKQGGRGRGSSGGGNRGRERRY
jgi:CxxC-x17-CxxC domain-containing protein